MTQDEHRKLEQKYLIALSLAVAFSHYGGLDSANRVRLDEMHKRLEEGFE